MNEAQMEFIVWAFSVVISIQLINAFSLQISRAGLEDAKWNNLFFKIIRNSIIIISVYMFLWTHDLMENLLTQ